MNIKSQVKFAIGDQLELEVIDLNSDARAVAKHEGAVFFIDQGLPEEVLLAKITKINKNFIEATRLQSLKASPHEVKAFCKYFGTCGGCSLQHLAYPEQLNWKQKRLTQSLKRLAGLQQLEVPQVLPSPKTTAYRNKMEYAFSTNPETGELLLGLRKKSSHEVIQLEGCPLQSETAAKILASVRAWAIRHKLAPYSVQQAKTRTVGRGELRFLILREPAYEPSGSPKRMLELICYNSPDQAAVQELTTELYDLQVNSVSFSVRRDKISIAKGEKLLKRLGEKYLEEKIDNTILKFSASSFMQTNSGATELLYKEAIKLANLKGTERVLDLYCGVGAISLYLANKVGSVFGVELEKDAIEAAQESAKQMELSNCKFESADVLEYLERLTGAEQSKKPAFDLIITDPPRTGMQAKAVSLLKKLKVQNILYISCDPSTLARDLKLLSPEYKLTKVQGVDMFPHTAHIETIVKLQRT